MLEVQKLLKSGKTLEKLDEELGIRATRCAQSTLVILNYSQVDSPKMHPATMECRGLTLDARNWEVVARAFPRFFNHGECPELQSKFDWESCVAEEKHDGSLMLLYRHEGQWRVNTRGSFAQGEIAPGVNKTWEECFYEAVDEVTLGDLAEQAIGTTHTFVFEYCSPYNKVVRRYEQPTLFLLAAFENASGREAHPGELDSIAQHLRVQRPARFASSLESVLSLIKAFDSPTHEGFVLKDKFGNRIKVKNKDYVALHQLKNNGNIFHPKAMVPLILRNEQEEVLLNLPECTEAVYDTIEKLGAARARLNAVWEHAKKFPDQKSFAQYVTKNTNLAGILFNARKQGKHPDEVFVESESMLLKTLFSKEGK